jgi:hypothetical protein
MPATDHVVIDLELQSELNLRISMAKLERFAKLGKVCIRKSVLVTNITNQLSQSLNIDPPGEISQRNIAILPPNLGNSNLEIRSERRMWQFIKCRPIKTKIRELKCVKDRRTNVSARKLAEKAGTGISGPSFDHNMVPPKNGFIALSVGRTSNYYPDSGVQAAGFETEEWSHNGQTDSSGSGLFHESASWQQSFKYFAAHGFDSSNLIFGARRDNPDDPLSESSHSERVLKIGKPFVDEAINFWKNEKRPFSSEMKFSRNVVHLPSISKVSSTDSHPSKKLREQDFQEPGLGRLTARQIDQLPNAHPNPIRIANLRTAKSLRKIRHNRSCQNFKEASFHIPAPGIEISSKS